MHGKTGFASRLLAIPLYHLDGTSKLTRGIVIPCRMQNLKSVAALGEELGGKEAKLKTKIFPEIMFSAGKACSTRFPGGNLVDGLPPVASTHAADFASRPAPNISVYNRWFFS